MHAVLLVSAKHLLYLSPKHSEYHQASLSHLSKLLPLYKKEVAKPLSVKNADSIMAASLLLMYFVWSNVEVFEIEDPACFAKDQLFAMTVGFRETVFSAWSILTTGQSIFSECTAYQPKYGVRKAAEHCTRTPSHFQRYFCDNYYNQNSTIAFKSVGRESPPVPQLPEIQNGEVKMSYNDLWYAITQPHDPLLVGFLDAAVRLAPISSIASELQTSSHHFNSRTENTGEEMVNGRVPLGRSPLAMADLARYVFSWPIVSSPGVLALLEQKDKSIIFLLYQFYEAIQAILPKTYWWAHQRAEKMLSIFNESLAQSSMNPLERDFTLPADVVGRATDFAMEVNEKWREYCRVYAAASTTRFETTRPMSIEERYR